MWMNGLKRIYRYYCPNCIRKLYRSRRFINDYREFYKWYKGEKEELEYAQKEIDYVIKNKLIDTIPYKWAETYRARNYKALKDENGWYCVIGNKKLYLPDTAVDGSNSDMVALVMAEQDTRSPHVYFDHDVCISGGGILFDIGAAEGLIALLNIERVKKAYIFESDENWIDALNKTFKPYEDKVCIINKFVSTKNDEYNTTLEPFLEKHEDDIVIIKMDIEGMEKDVLMNALGKYMGNKNLKFSCCTYHKADDGEQIKKIFENMGYNTRFSDGYMVFMNEKPYLRRGIIRAWK